MHKTLLVVVEKCSCDHSTGSNRIEKDWVHVFLGLVWGKEKMGGEGGVI